MIQKYHHPSALPDVTLTESIHAFELVPPDEVNGVSMSSHKIWIPPNVDYPPHTHPAPHMIVVVEGGGHALIGEDRSNLVAGDVFFVPGNVRHIVGADSRGMVMLAISSHSLPLTDPLRLVRVD